MRLNSPAYVLGLLVMAIAVAAPSPARSELQSRRAWASALGGYDSNVRRVSSDNPPPGLGVEDAARAVLGLGLTATYTAGRFKASLDARPYYIKYSSFAEFDRADIYGSLPLSYQFADRWFLDVVNTFRTIAYHNRTQWNQTYNNTVANIRYRSPSGWNAAAHYRFLYRANPSPNLDTTTSNGVGASVLVNPSKRLSTGLMLRYDDEYVDFIFPGGVNANRQWVDVSVRYQLGSKTIVLGKYLYQRDESDFPFDSGRDLDKLGEGAEAASDDILQSIRFLEDRDFNYRKHLLVSLFLVRPKTGHLLEGFLLYQHKTLDQRVLSATAQPRRKDETAIVQASYSKELTEKLRLFAYARYENVGSNDPDHDFISFTGGAGLRWTF